jgi:diguanylate cyclase (GGDEF)-like protein
MQDLEEGVRVGHGRLSAIPGEAGPKVKPFVDDVPVVPGQRLLDVASALSDGATLVHARLRHLDPDDRDAVLDLMAAQLSGIVSLWADLVRGVVPSPGPDTRPETSYRADRETLRERETLADRGSPPDRESLPSTDTHPSAQGQKIPRMASGAEAGRGAETRWPPRTGAVVGGETGPEPDPSPQPDPGIRRLPRRAAGILRRADDEGRRSAVTGGREPWAMPLRSVKEDDAESDFEGDRLTRDELTGVLNRQAGFAALGRDLDRCRRAGARFVLGYLDVDGLKEVNRTEGPRGGDELLRKVTAALRATLRSYDVIMRLGGDEFLFSLPGADMATAELRANEFGVILAEEAPGRSATVGFSQLRGNDTLDEIISRAENELVKNQNSRLRSR